MIKHPKTRVKVEKIGYFIFIPPLNQGCGSVFIFADLDLDLLLNADLDPEALKIRIQIQPNKISNKLLH